MQATDKQINLDRGVSQYGRVTSPYPLWDGTDRVLVVVPPCEVTKNGVVVPCSTLSAAELAMLADMNRPIAETAADPVQDNVPPPYAVYMFDPANQSMLPVATPPAGFMYVDPVAIQARTEPTPSPPRRSTRRSPRRTWARSTCAASTTPTASAAWARACSTAADAAGRLHAR